MFKILLCLIFSLDKNVSQNNFNALTTLSCCRIFAIRRTEAPVALAANMVIIRVGQGGAPWVSFPWSIAIKGAGIVGCSIKIEGEHTFFARVRFTHCCTASGAKALR